MLEPPEVVEVPEVLLPELPVDVPLVPGLVPVVPVLVPVPVVPVPVVPAPVGALVPLVVPFIEFVELVVPVPLVPAPLGCPLAEGAADVPVVGAPFIEGAPVFGVVVLASLVAPALAAEVCAGGGATVVSPGPGFTPIVGVNVVPCCVVPPVEVFVEDWAKAAKGIAPAARIAAMVRGEDVVFIHLKIARPRMAGGRGCGGVAYRVVPDFPGLKR